jgi:hypothetical protein
MTRTGKDLRQIFNNVTNAQFVSKVDRIGLKTGHRAGHIRDLLCDLFQPSPTVRWFISYALEKMEVGGRLGERM